MCYRVSCKNALPLGDAPHGVALAAGAGTASSRVIRDAMNAAAKDVGSNHVVSLHGGCAMQESWASTDGISGSSLTGYDADLRHWHQTWMDSTGGVLQLDGGLRAPVCGSIA